MCWADRCCICFGLYTGGNLLGIISIVFSSFFLTSSVILLFTERLDYSSAIGLGHSTYTLILSMLVVMSALGVVSACVLVYGLRKNKPAFVLYYFGHGIVAVIMALLGALLELLSAKTLWHIALTQIGGSMLYIHWLVVVHSIYDQLLLGKLSGVKTEDQQTLTDDLSDTHDMYILVG